VARRQDREREFHDDLFAQESAARSEVGRFYTVVGRSQDAYWHAVEARARTADCLEYGCAYGEGSRRVAAMAATAIGIDISAVAIGKAREAAAAAGSSARFEVAEAESLPFPDSRFDLAYGSGVLHHLDLEPAIAEMVRVLRPTGSCVFVEPLGHNPLINRYRARTPQMRTSDEHPLLKSDFAMFGRYFREVDVDFFHLASLAAIAFNGKPIMQPVLRSLNWLDDRLMGAVPPLRWQAWVCVIRLQGPRSAVE
jgi:SAM-dependent methyltransferase